MNKIWSAALVAAGIMAAVPASAEVTVTLSCGSVGKDQDFCREGAEAWAQKTGNKINLVSTPADSNETLALITQQLATGSSDIDIFSVDIVWPGILASNLLDLGQYADKSAVDQHFKPIIQANTVNGKLVAMPWFTDAGLLYYRKDLLEKYKKPVPATWQDLAKTAQEIQDAERKAGNDKMQGLVFQGKAYEGLTCNALEWIDSFGGGTVIDESGKVTINNPKAVAALEFAASTIGKIAPQGVLGYAEEEARGTFQSGNAVFMRNWPYAWSLAQADDSPIKGKVGVAALPKSSNGGKNTGTLGGWQLAVSKFSKNPKEAADLVLYLTGLEEQKRRAIKGSYNPTIGSLYKDQEILAANPFMGQLFDTFSNAVARPSKVTGAKYNQVSTAFWNTVSATLSGKGKAADNLAKLQTDLEKMSNGGKW